MHGKRPAYDGVLEQIHLFRAKTVPDTARVCLQLAAGQYGFIPRRSSADSVRKGTSKDSWAGWAWQEVDP